MSGNHNANQKPFSYGELMSTSTGIYSQLPTGKGCPHGKLWSEYCRQCEIIDTTRMRDEAVRRVAILNERLAELGVEK